MRGLFFKIFAIFWLAQSLIFIISTALLVRQNVPMHDLILGALNSNLQRIAEEAFRAFEQGGCPVFQNNASRYEPEGSALITWDGRLVCQTDRATSLNGLAAHFPMRIDSRRVGQRYLWLVPLTAANGVRYEYVWFQPSFSRRSPPRGRSLWHAAFPQLPVTIAVGGLTTFGLVLLFTRPLARLRMAARRLAEGDLTTRVEGVAPARPGKPMDDFQGLTHDFNYMAERMESLVGAQKLLLRDVSHELRSPLARLSVALELAREDSPPELADHLGRIEREADRLNLLIGELLTLSSMEATDRTATFTAVSLNSLLEQLLPDGEYEARQRQCSVVLKQAGPVSVHGNASLLHRAFENVLRNAIRYTASGTEVLVKLSCTRAHGRQAALIEVIDHGPGIPPGHFEKIFEPFHRLDDARTATTGGFGVGLAITDRAVRLHGGSVTARNLSGGGTCVSIHLPSVSADLCGSHEAGPPA